MKAAFLAAVVLLFISIAAHAVEVEVPEPGILHAAILLGTGLVGFAGYVKLRSRRRKK